MGRMIECELLNGLIDARLYDVDSDVVTLRGYELTRMQAHAELVANTVL
ncbi:MAG: hypothetical protein AAGA68_22765 [Pseudomonadota bacterium]